MKKYELLLILPGTLDEQESKNKIGETVDMLKEYAQDVELNSLGKNRLAYPIKQIRYGYFYTAVFLAEADKLSIIYKKLNLMRDLLRAMVTHFNTQISNSQKITYFVQECGLIPEEGTARTAKKERKVIIKETIPEREEEPIVTDEPVQTEEFDEQERESAKASVSAKPVDLKEIDKKLDEILSDDSMMDI